jgi:hypothetical protein
MHSTRQFEVNPQTKQMSAEMSELRGFVQIYPDACDEGLRIVSHVTGEESKWVVVREKRHEGEVCSWTLIPTQDTLRRLPQLRGWHVEVFND